MSRHPRVQYYLDTGNIKSLPDNEIKAILRAADELICTGGRNMLAKILKGSKEKKVLELGLDKCPAYGFYHSLTLERISHRVDWMIKNDYLQIKYNGRLPMIVFSDKGWEIERDTFSEELYQRFYLGMKENDYQILQEMKTVNRQVVFDILEKIRASREKDFLPLLKEWKKIEVRKVRDRIDCVEKSLNTAGNGPVIVWLRAEKSDTKRITKLVYDTITEVYPKHYPQDVTDFFVILHNEPRIRADIESKNTWMLLCDGKLVGTGSRNANHITRVYVLPAEQGHGFGSRIMDELENMIKQNFDAAELDTSIPAEHFYENHGYKTARTETLSVGNVSLQYNVMEKVFS